MSNDFSDMAIPRFPNPCPRGPVVVLFQVTHQIQGVQYWRIYFSKTLDVVIEILGYPKNTIMNTST